MKHLKSLLSILGLAAFLFTVGWIGEGKASGVSGYPFAPVFGAITGASQTLSGASTAASYTASGSNPQFSTNNGVADVWVGTNGSNQATVQSVGASATLHVVAAGNNCLSIGNGGGTLSTVLPCTTASGAGTYVPVLNAKGTTTSGQFYTSEISNNGTVCADNSGTLPSGWSVARTSAGVCTITHPSVSAVAKFIPAIVGAAANCTYAGATATVITVNCYNVGTSTLADHQFEIQIQDWN